MAFAAARHFTLGLVFLIAIPSGGAPVMAQTSDNLSTNRTAGNMQSGPSNLADNLPDGMVIPGPEAHDCPDDPTVPYAACIGAKPLRDGSFFEGHFRDDQPDGVGRQREADGTTYVGEFSQGRRHGFGTLYGPDGSELYKGQWKDGLPDDPEARYHRETELNNLIKALQAELNRNGCGAGVIDGIAGPKTRNAATAAADAKPEMLLDGDPFGNVQMLYRMLQSLKSSSSRACAA